MALQNADELLRGPGPRRSARQGLRPPRLRDARVGRPLLRARSGRSTDPADKALLATLVADNARHMLLFRERAAANGVDPDAYGAPTRARRSTTASPSSPALDELLGYALGSLDHFAELLTVYRGAADGGRREAIDSRPRRRRPDARRAARPSPATTAKALAAEAHELYRVRELVETRGTRMPSEAAIADASPSCSASCHRLDRARGASRRCAPRRGPARSSATDCGSATGTASSPGRSWTTSTRNRPSRPHALGRDIDRRLLRRRTCVAFRDIRALAEQAVRDAMAAADEPEPVVADLAAGPAPYLLQRCARGTERAGRARRHRAGRARRRARGGGAARRRRPRRRSSAPTRSTAPRSPRSAQARRRAGARPVRDRARRRASSSATSATSPSSSPPAQIVFNVQTRNPEIEYIARVWRQRGRRATASGGCGPVEQILGLRRGRRYTPASITADRFGIYRVVRLVRAEAARDERPHLDGRPGRGPARSPCRERLRALQASHHAMWNYVTYRDAIALARPRGRRPLSRGTTRLPSDWADLGWLTCFCGRPAIGGRGDARRGRAATRSTCTRPT